MMQLAVLDRAPEFKRNSYLTLLNNGYLLLNVAFSVSIRLSVVYDPFLSMLFQNFQTSVNADILQSNNAETLK